jgi:hypothetical protein
MFFMMVGLCQQGFGSFKDYKNTVFRIAFYIYSLRQFIVFSPLLFLFVFARFCCVFLIDYVLDKITAIDSLENWRREKNSF